MKLIKGLLAIAIVSLIAVSCNETKKGVQKDVESAADAVEETVDQAVEATAEAAEEAVEAVKAEFAGFSAIYPKDTKLAKQVNDGLNGMYKVFPALESYFLKSYGYAYFPKITKAGLGVGGAGGKGLVFEKNTVIGKTTLMQATIGFQAGGQQYEEIIFFEDKAALDRFKNNKFKFSAEASAVALKAGLTYNADYQDGVAVFTESEKGLMAEAALGTQKFKYKGGI